MYLDMIKVYSIVIVEKSIPENGISNTHVDESIQKMEQVILDMSNEPSFSNGGLVYKRWCYSMQIYR